ncbi:MAG TPA: DNA polymerase III subunit gamma/tau [Pyrinomonadaceae bacterium]|nr:DNA polymerase III subunit gamma/tau [Pyrinomonadaceae bacterium]
MSYQVIARKWRPQKFEDVTGQEILTRTLQNAIAHDRLHHAYLFSGARGVGKTTTARLVARALNCHKSDKPTGTPCAIIDESACASCREIAEGRSMDVLEIDAASNTGVGDVRDVIISGINIKPARDRYKVFIIDEVHMLSTSAFNALLKTIEEPPPRVVFIMATTDEHKVPETITSRCQLFEFRTIAAAKIAERLKLIARADKISIADEAIREIARAGDGSMRDAQSAFDQVISFAGEEIKTEDVEKALGIAGADVLARVVNGIAENHPADALEIVDDLVMRGHNLRNFCRDVLGHLRDLLVVKVSGDPKLLDSSSAQTAALQQQAALFSESDLVRFFHSLAETEASLKDAANARYQVEVGLVKLMEMRRLACLGDLVGRIAELESALRTGRAPAERKSLQASPSGAVSSGGRSQAAPSTRSANAAEYKTVGEVTTPTPIQDVNESNAPVVISEPPAATPGSIVDQIKAELEKRKRKLLAASMAAAARVELEGNELTLEFSPDAKHERSTMAKAENVRILREACAEVCGREIGIRFVIRDGEADDSSLSPEEDARRSKQKARQAAAQNPTVQQVLKTFGGEIVDVKMR